MSEDLQHPRVQRLEFRRNRTCVECGKPIPAGTVGVVISGVVDGGSRVTYYRCPPCHDLFDRICDEYPIGWMEAGCRDFLDGTMPDECPNVRAMCRTWLRQNAEVKP